MKKIILFLFAILSFSTITAQDAFDTVLAQVKLTHTTLIKMSEFNKGLNVFEAQLGKSLTPADKDILLGTLIDNELMLQAVKREGLNITEDMILNMLRQQVGAQATDQQIKDGISAQYKSSWPEVLKALTEQVSVQEYIKQFGAEELKALVTPITESEVVEFYNSNKTKFVNPDLVRVDHIYFSTIGKTDSESKEILKQAESSLLSIKQGKKSFDQIMQEVKEDKNDLTNSGDLGYISRDEDYFKQVLGLDFINNVFSLSMDEVHGVLKSNSGYHIVEITEKRSARLLKLTDPINPTTTTSVTQYIQQSLLQQKATKAYPQVTKSVIEKLKKEATIKIIDKSLPWK